MAAEGICQTLNLPPRAPDALTGSQFARITWTMSVAERENWIYSEVLSGNVPNFLRTLEPIPFSGNVNGTNHTGTYYVIPDYLAIGSDADYFLMPTTPLLAQRLCNGLGCTLPTRKMVNQIWTNAAVKLLPKPISASPAMITVPVFDDHNFIVRTQRNATTNAFPLGSLVSGHKKDVIISTKIYTNFATAITDVVVIYGWHNPSGSVIQPLYNGHEETYADYSHGIRLVQNAIVLDGGPNTITNVLTNTNLAALLSDEGASEGTSAGVIRVPRYTIGPLPLAILNQGRSQTILAGQTASFQVKAMGVPPLGYRWQHNGVTVPGATNANLIISNAQPANAGTYTVVVTNSTGSLTSRPALLRFKTNVFPVLMADSFDNLSTNWNVFWGASNGIPDYTVDLSFDHHLIPYSINGVSALIPPAPNSSAGTARAAMFTVNNNDTNSSTAAVNIYPKQGTFSGNFALKFDLWINYPGPAGGSFGSTEHAIFGVNHLGTRVNWAAPSASSSDGLWFGVDGEGGDSRDYRAYRGNLGGMQVELTGASSGLSVSNNSAPFFLSLFPASRFESAGAPGKNWVEVELRHTNNIINWLMDGTVVAQRTNNSSFTTGKIMLGFMDVFSSIAAVPEEAFVLFDNVQVLDLSGRVRFLSVAREPSQLVHLVFSAVPGRSYTLESSTNLVQWELVTNLTSTNGPVHFIDPEIPVLNRFYRVRQ